MPRLGAADLDVFPLAFAQPTIVAPIAGASAPEQVAPLLASAKLELSDEELAQLTRASDAYAGATAATA